MYLQNAGIKWSKFQHSFYHLSKRGIRVCNQPNDAGANHAIIRGHVLITHANARSKQSLPYVGNNKSTGTLTTQV